jgi:hypothetical protein
VTAALPAAPADGGDEPQDVVRPLPTPDDLREEIRRTIKEGLASGRIDSNDVLADMYASIYAVEISGRKMFAFMEQLAGSPLFSRFIGGGKRGKKKGASLPGLGEIDMEAMAAEVERTLTVIEGDKDGTVQG